MAWLALAAVLLLFNIIFVRKMFFMRYWTGGLWAVVVAYLVIHIAITLNLSQFDNYIYAVQNIPLFLLIAAFFFGTLFVRFQPDKKGWQLIYVIFVSAGIVIIESFYKEINMVIYNNWYSYLSFIVYFFSLITLIWLSELTVTKRRGYFFH